MAAGRVRERALHSITSTETALHSWETPPGAHSSKVGRLTEPGEGSRVIHILSLLPLQLPGGSREHTIERDPLRVSA